MGIGLSILLIAIGAILTWAVTFTVVGVSIHLVGVILMIVGAIGLLVALIALTSARRGTAVHEGP
jgi:TRAP-type C4-dicarboxylate transport system permease small subunit